MKYEEAIKEIESIMIRMENEEMELDNLTKQLKRARELIAFCNEKLRKTNEEIQKIISNEEPS